MLLMTMIARVDDGLILTSCMDDEQSGNLTDYHNQAKMLFRKMNHNSPDKGSLETDNYLFHYSIDRGVAYLTLTTGRFSKRISFAYLEHLQTEFHSRYGNRIHTASRPYAFLEFDTFIQKSKKNFEDSRSRRNLDTLNSQLNEVHKIVAQNIGDVLQRGEALTALDDKACLLANESKKYKKDAKKLNLMTSLSKYLAIIVVIIIVLLFLRYIIF